MSNAVIDKNVSPSNTPGKGLNIALWVVQGLLALAFVGSASGKRLGQPETVGLFDAIGVGQWFRYRIVAYASSRSARPCRWTTKLFAGGSNGSATADSTRSGIGVGRVGLR